MDRANHYEAAFEGYLRSRSLGYVAVDESRRALLGDGSVKSLDFIVHGHAGSRLLVDIKGRRFPSGPPGKPRRVWDAWSFREDLRGLETWGELFGPGFTPMLVFAFCLAADIHTDEEIYIFRGRRYLLLGTPLDDYKERMRRRSPRWDTVDLSAADFRRIAQPFHAFTDAAAPLLEDCPF